MKNNDKEENFLKETVKEKEDNKINKYLVKRLTPKLRYEVALRYGLFLKEEEENIDINGIKHLEKDGLITEIKGKKIKKITKELETSNPENDNMGKILSSTDTAEMINLANLKYTNVGLKAGERLGEFLDNLSIVTVYMRNNITIKKIKNPKNNNFMKKTNLKIIDNAIQKSYKKFDSDYFIRFIDVIYEKYGENINEEAMYKIIEQICISDKNEEMLEFVKEILEQFDRLKLEGLSNIINTLQERVILNPYQESDSNRFEKNERTLELMEKQEDRNIKLKMIRDIVKSIDFKIDEEQELIEYINKISKLSPEKLQEYWLSFTNEITNIKVANERIDKYSIMQYKQKEENTPKTKRKLKKPDIMLQKYGEKNGKMYKRAKIAGLALGVIIGGSTILNGMNFVMKSVNNKKEIYIKSDLPIPIADDNGNMIFKANEKVIIKLDGNKVRGTIESQDGKKIYHFDIGDIEENSNLRNILNRYVPDEKQKAENDEER